MSVLYLVRHGQASFLSDDYDRLSDVGIQQSKLLGKHWQSRGLVLTHCFSGSLQRQRHTAEAVGSAYDEAGDGFPELNIIEGLNEYPADEMMALLVPAMRATDRDIAVNAEAFENAKTDQDRYRYVHRLLEAVMRVWVRGDYDQDKIDLPTWSAFSGGVRQSLQTILQNAPSRSAVAVFTSGGPIGIAVQTILESPELKAAELNWRVHNASVSSVTFSGLRMSLDSFNSVEHLPLDMRTYR
ncbi:MAG: histidine phosphatase family protein [Woeseiaceae bacterium]